MQLPSLDYEYSDRSVTDTFAGYNHKLKIADGEFYDTRNLTSEYYPLLAERRKRGLVKQLTAPGGLLGKEKLAYVDNGVLYYDGEATGLTGLTPGEKQLVSMGAYICIFPDKKYYNTADANDRGSMEAYYTSTGAVKYTMCRVDGTDYGTAYKIHLRHAPAQAHAARLLRHGLLQQPRHHDVVKLALASAHGVYDLVAVDIGLRAAYGHSVVFPEQPRQLSLGYELQLRVHRRD